LEHPKQAFAPGPSLPWFVDQTRNREGVTVAEVTSMILESAREPAFTTFSSSDVDILPCVREACTDNMQRTILERCLEGAGIGEGAIEIMSIVPGEPVPEGAINIRVLDPE
jgi:hypothetical protein